MSEKHLNTQDKTLSRKSTIAVSINHFKKEKSLNDKISNDPGLTTGSNSHTQSTTQYGNTSGNVKVVCRVRPLNQREITSSTNVCLEFPDDQTIALKTTQQHSEMAPGLHKFQFDRVFDMKINQAEVYNFAAKPIVESILEGFNGTIFAYGQTSSGKTHTMQGPNIDDPQLKGIIPRMVKTVFEVISATPDHIEFTVKVSIVEIYMERIRDLISPEKINLKIREDKVRGVYIEDVTESYVSEEKDVYDIMRLGNSNRAISATNMNEGSSRSHLIFMMSINQNNLHEMSAKTGKLFLVDLAGSEKTSKTGAEGRTLEEAKKINQSLSALGNVINALTDGKTHHVPYRNSKLTRVLQESLGGNSRTTLIITCSPSSINEQETLSTLRFGFRAKAIKNTPKINRQFTIAELQLLLEKSEKKLEYQSNRVKNLENLLASFGHVIPKDDDWGNMKPIEETRNEREEKISDMNESFSSDEEIEINSSSLLKKDELNSISTIINNDDLTRIKLLEQELEQEKNSVRIQTEKLNILRKEYANLNAKYITIEKENEAFKHNITTLTLKTQELEENIKEKDFKLEELNSLYQLRDDLIEQVDNLKSVREQLLKTIDEKNDEIEKMKGLISANKHHREHSNPSKSILSTSNNNINALNDDGPRKELIKAINEKLELLEDKNSAKILQDLFNKLITNAQAGSYINEEFKVDIQKLRKELIQEQERNFKQRSDYEKLSKEYDKISRLSIPNYDDIKQKIIDEVLIKERTRYDKDKALILKELQGKMDKIVKMEVELDEEREKNKALETKMSDSEKKLKLKVNMLRTNLEQQLSNMYHQLAAQRDRWNLENQLNQKKIERKTERILALEKQLLEAKELVAQYKARIESLKAFFTISSSNRLSANELLNENQENMLVETVIGGVGSGTGVGNNNQQGIIGGGGEGGNNIEDIKYLDDIMRKSNQGSSVSNRIVKPIRGGLLKSSNHSRLVSITNSEIKDKKDDTKP